MSLHEIKAKNDLVAKCIIEEFEVIKQFYKIEDKDIVDDTSKLLTILATWDMSDKKETNTIINNFVNVVSLTNKIHSRLYNKDIISIKDHADNSNGIMLFSKYATPELIAYLNTIVRGHVNE